MMSHLGVFVVVAIISRYILRTMSDCTHTTATKKINSYDDEDDNDNADYGKKGQ